MLDACRDNPFEAAASGKGLAPLDAPPGTFLAYATAPGNVARDGTEASGHGLYTQYLLEELEKPEAKIEDVFKRVRTNVRQQSHGRQIPWESTSLEEDFYFGGAPAAAVTEPLEAGNLEALARQQSEFEAEKAEWDRIRDSSKPDDFFAYLSTHPNGFMSEQAQFRLDQLQKPVIEVQAKKGEVVALKSGVRRYEVGDELEYESFDRIQFTTRRYKEKVVSADDKRVVFDTGFMVDQMGSILRNQFGEKDPGILLAPADIEVGKKWRTAFTNRESNGRTGSNFYNVRVVRVEEITVPAGRFTTFRVERRGASDSQTQVGTMWIDPKTMYSVKNEFIFYRGGRRVEDRTQTLVSFKQAPR